jgi:hypothetical protein
MRGDFISGHPRHPSNPHRLADLISRTTIKNHDQVPRCGCGSRSTRWILFPWNLILFQDVWQTDKIGQCPWKKLGSSSLSVIVLWSTCSHVLFSWVGHVKILVHVEKIAVDLSIMQAHGTFAETLGHDALLQPLNNDPCSITSRFSNLGVMRCYCSLFVLVAARIGGWHQCLDSCKSACTTFCSQDPGARKR